MWVTILRPTTWPPLFWNQIPVSPKLCTQSLFSIVIPYTSRISGLSPITQVLSTLSSAWKLHLGQNLEWREAWAFLEGTIPDRDTVTTETAVCTNKRGWTHYTQVKWAHQEEHWTMCSKPGDTRVTLKNSSGTIVFPALRKLHYYY
jgi:hypothetical protein